MLRARCRRVRRRPRRSARRWAPTNGSANSASSAGSRSTSRRCTAPSIRRTRRPTWSSSSGGWQQLERAMTTDALVDVVVIGDGPAGSALAHGCARQGVDTVLVGAAEPTGRRRTAAGSTISSRRSRPRSSGRSASPSRCPISRSSPIGDRSSPAPYGVLDNDAAAAPLPSRASITDRQHVERVERGRRRPSGRAGATVRRSGAGS